MIVLYSLAHVDIMLTTGVVLGQVVHVDLLFANCRRKAAVRTVKSKADQ